MRSIAWQGFSFPLNPVWPIRDPGWLEVLHELQRHEEPADNLQKWFPPDSGVLQRIEKIHEEYPDGFKVVAERTTPVVRSRRVSFWKNMINPDMDTRDMANFASLELRRQTKVRWKRVRDSIKLSLHENSPRNPGATNARADAFSECSTASTVAASELSAASEFSAQQGASEFSAQQGWSAVD